ncbi:MAG TPA: HepT-like ribonuclease domain-containing protein [Thermoanaerobaculia bacterium]|nr:HepT-like ribonuclease domain-containing protein [Thermoanaerobaculia bacterium]
MQPDLRDAGYLADMLRFSREAIAIATDAGGEVDLRSGRALERTISLIGEAANHVSRDFQAAHPEIPWSDIIGQRHWLVHGYREIQWARLLEVVETHLPELIRQLGDLVPPVPES